MNERNYWTRMKRNRLSRRSLLRASARAGVGAAGLALVGCGDDDDDDQSAAAVQQDQQQQQAQAQQQAMQDQQQQAQAQQQAEQAAQQEQQAQQAQQQQSRTDSTVEQATISEAEDTGEQPRQGGQLDVAFFASVSNFDPHANPNGGDWFTFFPFLYDRLLDYDDRGRAIPMIAESWETPDDVTYILKIRENAFFHDDTPINAEAVALNYQRMKVVEEEVSGTSRITDWIREAVTMEAIDEFTFHLGNAAPYAPTLAGLFALPAASMLMSPDTFDVVTDEPIGGSGPWKFSRYEHDNVFEVDRFDKYWNSDEFGTQLPYLDRVVAPIIPDANTRYAELLAGSVDYGGPPQGTDPENVYPLADDGFQIWQGLGQTWVHHFFNFRGDRDGPNGMGVYRDTRTRLAWNLAIDRSAIFDIALSGVGGICRGPHSNASWAIPPDKDYYADSPNLEEAQKLMDAAGFSDGFDAVYNGFDFTPMPQIAETIQAMVGRIGQRLEIQIEKIPASVDKILQGNYDVSNYSYESPYDPSSYYGAHFPQPTDDFPGTLIHGEYLTAEPASQEMITAYGDAARKTDQTEREQLYDKANQLITDYGWDYGSVQFGGFLLAQPWMRGMHRRPVDGRIGYEAKIWETDA